MFKQLRQAASKLSEMVGIDGHSQPQAGVDGDPLDEARARVETLRVSMEGMKSTLLNYSRQLLTFSQSAAQVSQEWAGLYSHSPGRSNTLQTFTTNQGRIESTGFRLYKDNYGWDILKVFDDWEQDANKMLQDIEKTNKARQKVAGEDEKVRSLRASKERRLKNNQPLTPKEEDQLEAAEQILEKYSVMLSNMRVNLDKSLTHFFEQRFATLDKAFVRFMEMQVEFFKEGHGASSNYQSIIDNYRKRFPRQQSGQYGPTPDARSPLPQVNGSQAHQNGEDLLGVGTADQASAPIRTRSTPPQPQHEDEPSQRPPQRSTTTPSQTQPAASQAARKPQQPVDEDSSSSDSDSSDGSDSSSDDDDDESHAPHQHQHHHHHRSAPAAEPVIDLFNFPATAAPSAAAAPASKPAPKSTPSPSSGDDLVDFFGATSVSKPPPPAKPANNSNPSGDFDFDFSGGFNNNSSASSSSNTSKHLPTSSSTPNFPHQKKDDLLAFDPFGLSSPPSNAAASSSSSSSKPTKARSASPPPAAPGTSQSGMVNAYIPPTHKLEEHIANQQEAKIAALREADDAAEQALEARKEAEKGLEGQLQAWEVNKDGNKKNIRNLLSSVHTVLWANSGWKPVSFADLIDFNAIKKAHMKVIRVVHPDRLTDATPEQMVVALRVFDTLNTAFDQFKEEQGM